MTLFKSPLSHFPHKVKVVSTNMSLGSWCQESNTQSARHVQRVEMCTALCSGRDVLNMPLGKDHYHTLLRVFLESCPGASEDTLLIERVLSTGGACHSVTPISETFSTGGTHFHPEVHNRICVVANGPSTALAHDLVVERTLAFGDLHSDPRLTLAQFAQILGLISRSTKLICDGGDCKFQSRAFAFTLLAALTPTLPPREVGEGMASKVGRGPKLVDDSVFELSAEAFLLQVPWLVPGDQALKIIDTVLDGKPREMGRRRLDH